MENENPNKIEVDIDAGNAQDQIFYKMHQLIESGQRKEVLKKALVYYLMHEDDTELEKSFGEGLKEAKILAKIKLIRTDMVDM